MVYIAGERFDEVKYNSFILTNNSKFRQIWNVVIIILLLYTCTYLPFSMAFVEKDNEAEVIAGYVIDFLFFVDIIVNFLSSYNDR